MAVYDGYELYPTFPNREAALPGTWERTGQMLDGQTGARRFDDHAARGRTLPTLPVFLPGRASILAFFDFLDTLKGRAVPFWVPSWQQGLRLIVPGGIGDTGLICYSDGYVRQQWPLPHRRRIVLATGQPITPAMCRKVISAATVTGRDALGLDAALTVAAPLATPIMFLLLVRQDDDTAKITWHSNAVASCQLRLAELPDEVEVPT